MTNAEFAQAVAYLSKTCAAWAGDALTLPELLTEPVREDELRQFLTDIRRRLDYLESRAARHPDPRDG